MEKPQAIQLFMYSTEERWGLLYNRSLGSESAKGHYQMTLLKPHKLKMDLVRAPV